MNEETETNIGQSQPPTQDNGENESGFIHRRGKYNAIKVIVLSILTAGLYYYIFLHRLSSDLNHITTAPGSKKIPDGGYFLFIVSVLCSILGFTVGPLAGILYIVSYFWWMDAACGRIQRWLKERKMWMNEFSRKTFWVWNTIGLLFAGVGPLVFFFLLCHAMEDLCQDYVVQMATKQTLPRDKNVPIRVPLKQAERIIQINREEVSEIREKVKEIADEKGP